MAAKAVRFGVHLKELRLHLCPKSASSKGVRDFIENNYVMLKKSNPKLPILIRECSSIEPKLYARYEFGQESSLSLNGLNSQQVLKSVETLATKS